MRPALPVSLALLLLLVLPAALFAQELPRASGVSGTVVDQITRAPLAGVLVELTTLDRRVITDAQGRFTVIGLAPGTYAVRVSQLGYQEYRATWTVGDAVSTLTVALGANPITLEGVTVEAFTFGERLRERRERSTYAVRAIDRNQLSMTGSSSAFDAMQQGSLITRTSCPRGGRGICIWTRGRTVQPEVYIDERRALADELEMYRPSELYAIEVYHGGRHIRAYTLHWVETQARRNRPPAPLVIW